MGLMIYYNLALIKIKFVNEDETDQHNVSRELEVHNA